MGAGRARLGAVRAAASRRSFSSSDASRRKQTTENGRYVLRLAIGNARTTEVDVLQAWDVLRREAAAL